MILTNREKLLDDILNSILDTSSIEDLEKTRIRLETEPFCGIDMCYDLEHVVFYLLDTEQRRLVFEHISRLIGEPRIHIFTTLDFIDSLSRKERELLSIEDIEFLTILTGNSEKDEYTSRFRNKKMNKTIISGLPSIDKTGVESFENILLDAEADNVATDYYKTIINYIKLFPNYKPIFIDRLTPVSILITKKMNERKALEPEFQWIGSILQGSYLDDLKTLHIEYFQTGRELLDILENITVLTH